MAEVSSTARVNVDAKELFQSVITPVLSDDDSLFQLKQPRRVCKLPTSLVTLLRNLLEKMDGKA